MDTAFLIRAAAAKFPARTALRWRESSLTFAELDLWTDRLASGLRNAGVTGPVASILLNDPRTVCLYLALARAGITSVPLNYRLTAEEQAYILTDSGASVIVADSTVLGNYPDLKELVPRVTRVLTVDPEGSIESTFEGYLADASVGEVDRSVSEADDATVIYTSGTSGFPKGVVRSHRANIWNAVNSFVGSPRTPTDVELFSLPLFGIGYVAQVLPTLLAGGAVVLDRAFDPLRAWTLMEQHRVTRAFLAPTMIAALLDIQGHARFDVDALRTILVAYEFPAALRQRALDRFGDVFVNMYGLTEAQLCATAPGEFASDPSSAGRPMGLARVHILGVDEVAVGPGEVGEIAFEGPSLMTRYHARDEDTAAALRNGLLRTGDLGYLDENRNLHFVGRSKEIIKSGGFSIDPVEIENVLLEVDWITEAAAVGVPDDYWGEKVVAFLTVTGPVVDADLREHCRTKLAGFKVPKEFVVLDRLPINPTGKVERDALRRAWQEDNS